MDLTYECKAHIDALSYEELLSRWRFEASGSPWFQGESGTYWGERMNELRNAPGGNDIHVRASKKIGW